MREIKWRIAGGLLVIGIFLEILNWVVPIKEGNLWLLHEIISKIFLFIGVFRVLNRLSTNPGSARPS